MAVMISEWQKFLILKLQMNLVLNPSETWGGNTN